jgi:hypothetical protein
MDTKIKTKTGPKDLKQKRILSKEIPTRNTSAGGWSSGAPLRRPAATSEPAVEISVKNRDEPAFRNLSEVKSKTTFLGVSSTDTPFLAYLQQEDWGT